MVHYLKQAGVIIRAAWVKNITYRFTVLAYRIGEIAEVLVLILMWSAIYAGGSGVVKGFTLPEMITYVLIGNFSLAVTRNFLASLVSVDINQGRLSMYLIKPVSYIQYAFIHELGRIFLAMTMSVANQVLLILCFKSTFIFNTDPRYLAIFIVMLIFAFVIEMLIGFLIGIIAFWTDEVNGIQTTIDRVKRFFSGGYFPLSLLPLTFLTISNYLPFSYSFFVPAQLYLKKITLVEGLQGLVVQIVWIALLSIIVAIVWNRGLRKYEATGA